MQSILTAHKLALATAPGVLLVHSSRAANPLPAAAVTHPPCPPPPLPQPPVRSSHPEEVRKFYALVDDFHRMWDVVTEFDSLSHLATQMVPVRLPMPRGRCRHVCVLAGALAATAGGSILLTNPTPPPPPVCRRTASDA